MAWFLGQSLLIIIAAILLGVLVGWLIWGRPARPAPTEPHTAAAAEPQGSETASAEAAPDPDEPEPLKPEPVPTEPAPTPAEPATLTEPATPAEPAMLTEPAPVAEPVAQAATGTNATGTNDAGTNDAGTNAAVTDAARADDDLERIEGIGPKMAGALRQAGLRSFRQLADADEAKLRKAIEDAGFSFAPSLTTWSRQARLLADRDEEGFADLVRRLVAGRDVARS